MSKEKFDIYDYVHNNKFEIGAEKGKDSKKPFKGYNDIRKTVISEAKVKDGKFSIQESLKGENPDKKPLSTEVKKHFLEIISTYNTYQEQMARQSDIIEVAETLGGIVGAARELTLHEAEDWFDKVTIKRNMKQLEKLEKDFDKVAQEAKSVDSRMQALYEDMGHILNRYYEVSDIDPAVMRKRLGQKEKTVNETVNLKPTGKKDSWGRPIYKDTKGNIYKDIELGKGKTPDIHSTTKSGEPNSRVKDFKINESKSKKKSKPSLKEIVLGK